MMKEKGYSQSMISRAVNYRTNSSLSRKIRVEAVNFYKAIIIR